MDELEHYKRLYLQAENDVARWSKRALDAEAELAKRGTDVSLPWQVGAYIKLGVERDKMDPEHVAIVQDFIGPNPPSDTDGSIK